MKIVLWRTPLIYSGQFALVAKTDCQHSLSLPPMPNVTHLLLVNAKCETASWWDMFGAPTDDVLLQNLLTFVVQHREGKHE